MNVYQYGDETIDLAGGRLLLRGVNGSGKSTAMNMLLPFLLEADVRRIDAAGEQTGVLRSWMLTGREEPNPVGYLWIEFQRINEATGEVDYFVCGCGIRASASTERVTTWWFITERRPGIDFAFLDRRTPLSIDALRTALGTHAVFTQDRRSDYRTEVRARLFGGADLDQHIRLLHIVRSPRVGDRIDVDLPDYLGAALPQLSENALSDAAQPLEDLDEHRDSVAALARTADALDGLATIYQSYARRELRTRAGNTSELHGVVRRARRDKEMASANASRAAQAMENAEATVKQLEAAQSQLEGELQALRDRPAYRDGAELVDLRAHVASLTDESRTIESDTVELARRRTEAARRIAERQGAFSVATGNVRALLEEIGSLGAAWRINALPPFPGIESSSELESDVTGVLVPIGSTVDLSALRSALTEMAMSAELRRTDIREVVALLDSAAQLEGELRAAEATQRRRVDEATKADDELSRTLAARDEAESNWRASARVWLDALPLFEHNHHQVSAAECSEAIRRTDLVEGLEEIVSTLTSAVQAIADEFRQEVAELVSLLKAQREDVKRYIAARDELANATLPSPPATAWQRSDRRSVLAEMIDFAPGVSEDQQLNIEAAMEASGLLGAEVLSTGDVELVDGELIIVPSNPVPSPLGEFVVAIDGSVHVTGILNAVTTDTATNIATDTATNIATNTNSASLPGQPHTLIATDGTFRVGALRGKHSKSVVEHIGVSNRRAALERRRTEAATALAAAETTATATERQLDECRQRMANAEQHRNELPSTQPLRKAVAVSDAASQVAERARVAVDDATRGVARADAVHGEKVADATRVAANHQLPFDRERLRNGNEAMVGLIAECRSAEPRLGAVEGSLRDWSTSVDQWRRSKVDHLERQERGTEHNAKLAVQQARLGTIEDTLGAALAEVLELIDVVEKDRIKNRDELQGARSSVTGAAAEQSRTQEIERTAGSTLADRESRCVATLPGLVATLAIRGLVASAVRESAVPSGGGESPTAPVPSETTTVWPNVTDSADGARDLAFAIERTIPVPGRDDVGADNVRQSLRQRRENLGAGWDAEDHQPDSSQPLAIVVTGPLGRMPLADASAEVTTQLRQQSSLLTAKQDQALRNLLQGVVATEVAEKLFTAGELVKMMNKRLATVKTAHGIGASLRWRRRDTLTEDLIELVDLLAKSPDHRDGDENARLAAGLSARIDAARRENPDSTYRDLIAKVLDYRSWHEMSVLVHRPGENPRPLARHPRLSEGEKKVVSYLPLFAAVAASCDALAEHSKHAPRFLLLDDAFAKVSEDNHGPLFGLLVDLDLDFIATSERLWGTHASVPELSICEVVRDAEMRTIVLEHARWNGRSLVSGVAGKLLSGRDADENGHLA